MGPSRPPRRETRLTRYILDTSVLVSLLRGDESTRSLLHRMLSLGHNLAVACVTVAEIERGIRPRERKAADNLLARLEYLETTREAAIRSGRDQVEWARRGQTIHLGDALIAGTARVHGAAVITHNLDDFPMGDVRVLHPSSV